MFPISRPTCGTFSISLFSLAAALVLTCVLGLAPAAFAAPDAATLDALGATGKILNPAEALEPFELGKEKARFIVVLQEPQEVADAIARSGMQAKELVLGTEESKSQRRGVVAQNRERVINALNLPEQAITNRFQYMSGFSVEATAEQVLAIAQNPDVVSIEMDVVLEPNLAQGIPLMSATTPRSTYTGNGMAVAICDTGVDYNHPMLGGGSFPNSKVIGGYDTGENKADPMDRQGHGTACAGISAGDIPGSTIGDYIGGVAPDAKVYALKMTYTSTGGSAYTADMVEAWEWCLTHQNDNPNYPIMVISTSFGGGQYSSACDSHAMATAAANALAAGITVFASSGNDGWCSSMGGPACISDVISVGAVYDANFGTYYPCVDSGSCATKFSTSGCSSGWYAVDNTAADMVTSYSNSASFLDIFAPSNQAYTTGLSSGYNTSFGGTSAACPYAAGAALVLQDAAKTKTGSYLTPAQVRSYLADNGDLITDGKVSITKPRVDLAAAVSALPGSSGGAGLAVLPLGGNLFVVGGGGAPVAVVGAWDVNYDWDCDGSYSTTRMTLNADNTFSSSESHYGTWTMSGSTLICTYTTGGQAVYTGTVSGNTWNGTMVSTLNSISGCFTSTKVATDAPMEAVEGGGAEGPDSSGQ